MAFICLRVNIITSCIMLLIGVFGIEFGLHWHGLRNAPNVDAVLTKMASGHRQVKPRSDESRVADVPSFAREGKRYSLSQTMPQNSVYMRARFAAWLGRSVLTPDARSRVAEILKQHAETLFRLEAKPVSRFPREVLESTRRAAIDELVEAMRPVLGEYELTEFRHELAYREIECAVDQLGAELYQDANSLSVSQIMLLKSSLLESRSPEDQVAPIVELSTTDWNRALAKAADFLSAAQLEALLRFAKKSQFDQQFQTYVGLPAGELIPGI